MSDNSSQNGWNEYSRLVLKELENLSDGLESLRSEIQTLNQEITKLQAKEDRVDELRQWKERIDEVVSPTQLKAAVVEIESLKSFKTKAITVFTVVQFAMAAAAWALKIF